MAATLDYKDEFQLSNILSQKDVQKDSQVSRVIIQAWLDSGYYVSQVNILNT
jgi:hypothetical protein